MSEIIIKIDSKEVKKIQEGLKKRGVSVYMKESNNESMTSNCNLSKINRQWSKLW